MFTRKYGLQVWEKSSTYWWNQTIVLKSLQFVSEKIRQSLAIWRKETLECSQRRFLTSSEVIPTVAVTLKFQGNDATWKMEKVFPWEFVRKFWGDRGISFELVKVRILRIRIKESWLYMKKYNKYVDQSFCINICSKLLHWISNVCYNARYSCW